MNQEKAMDLDQFETMLALWGTEQRSWPIDQQSDAMALLAQSAHARFALERMKAVDQELLVLGREEAAIPAALSERILADAADVIADRRPVKTTGETSHGAAFSLISWIQRVGQPAAVFAASAMIGLWVGYSAPGGVAEAASAIVVPKATAPLAMLDLGDGLAMDLRMPLFETEGAR